MGCVITPEAATHDAQGSLLRPGGVVTAGKCGGMPVGTPFPDVTVHVEEPPRVRQFAGDFTQPASGVVAEPAIVTEHSAIVSK